MQSEAEGTDQTLIQKSQKEEREEFLEEEGVEVNEDSNIHPDELSGDEN
jgi:hypothetical protein